MLEKAIKQADKLYILKDGNEHQLNGIKKMILDLLEGSYSSPSYWVGSSAPIDTLVKKDIWVVAKFESPIDYLGTCDTIFFVLKKGYDFLNVIRKLDGNVLDKCVTINLAYKVDYLLNFINESIK